MRPVLAVNSVSRTISGIKACGDTVMPEGDEPNESSSRPGYIRSIGNRTHQTGLLLLWLVLAAAAENQGPTENEKWATQMNLEYMSPGEPVRDKPRRKCSGMSQLETLKGEWVKHPEHSYRGMSDMRKCPPFIADYDCQADYVDKKYRQHAEKEFRKIFEPYGCELHDFNASHFSQCMKGRRLIIVGDSTMRQVFQSLACMLHEEVKSGWFVDWDKANSSQTAIPFERRYTLSDEPSVSILKQNVGMFTLSSGADVYIQSFGIFNLTLWDDVFAQFEPLTERDTILVEFGAWYPRFSIWNMHRPWERYRRDVWDLFDLRLRRTSARVLWRAYGPTHFGGPTGTFTGLNSALTDMPTPDMCEPATYGEYYYDTEVMMYLKGFCKEDCAHIHMLPVYHLSLAAHNSHHGSYGRGIEEGQIDCRHYCANVIDTWNQVLYNKLCFQGADVAHS